MDTAEKKDTTGLTAPMHQKTGYTFPITRYQSRPPKRVSFGTKGQNTGAVGMKNAKRLWNCNSAMLPRLRPEEQQPESVASVVMQGIPVETVQR